MNTYTQNKKTVARVAMVLLLLSIVYARYEHMKHQEAIKNRQEVIDKIYNCDKNPLQYYCSW